jgi:hypothetical protein
VTAITVPGYSCRCPLEPRDRLGVEVVGRLVEQQQVGLLEQEPAERDATPLAARERVDLRVARRTAQRVHRDLEPALELPALRRVDLVLQLALLLEQRVHLVVGELLREARGDLLEAAQQVADLREPLLDVAEHVLRGIEPWLLRQEADLDAVGGMGFAEELLVLAGEDPQQRALALSRSGRRRRSSRRVGTRASRRRG